MNGPKKVAPQLHDRIKSIGEVKEIIDKFKDDIKKFGENFEEKEICGIKFIKNLETMKRLENTIIITLDENYRRRFYRDRVNREIIENIEEQKRYKLYATNDQNNDFWDGFIFFDKIIKTSTKADNNLIVYASNDFINGANLYNEPSVYNPDTNRNVLSNREIGMRVVSKYFEKNNEGVSVVVWI
jgi:hypothetical protein